MVNALSRQVQFNPKFEHFLLAHFIELRDREEKMLFAELAAAPLQ